MQIDSQTFVSKLPAEVEWEENFFRYCTFDGLDEEGMHSDSAFLGCQFLRCEWYWGLFNCAVFVSVKFVDCKFRGTSFASCKFVECEFERCEFTLDNLGGGCNFADSRWYACAKRDTPGLEHVPEIAL